MAELTHNDNYIIRDRPVHVVVDVAARARFESQSVSAFREARPSELIQRRCDRIFSEAPVHPVAPFCLAAGAIHLQSPVVSLFVANLLTRETLALVEGTYEIASRQQQAKNHSLLRQTAYDRSIRVRVRSRKASRRRIVQATTGCGPYISVRAGCKTGCAKMSMNIYPCM